MFMIKPIVKPAKKRVHYVCTEIKRLARIEAENVIILILIGVILLKLV